MAYSPLVQRFSIPFLAYPCSAHFVRFSYRFRCLYYSTVSALRSGHHITGYSAIIPVRSEHICSIQIALKCARREFKLYLFTEVYYVTLHASQVSFVCVCVDVAPHKSVNECYKVKLTSKDFPFSGSKEQWTLCRDHVIT